ncbi:MAG TPA: AAA family ATPase [Candidatus Ozemobacteraceae bacterium]|nr:AAA family ATPase [Candidatus Ozemobacteraceae bacterium]
MRLKHILISEYKNLKNFELSFDGNSFIDVFVGKNGTGKSNLFEALIEIFNHIYNSRRRKARLQFAYSLGYEINGNNFELKWDTNEFFIEGKKRTTTSNVSLPDNVLAYYSGHNTAVTKLVKSYETAFRRRIKQIDPNESRYFLGIGPDYKELLLATLLIQPDQNKARSYICNKLGITKVGDTVTFTLKRHLLVNKKQHFDHLDSATRFWGITGIAREFLDLLILCIKGEFNLNSLYDEKKDVYTIPVNVELFRVRFNGKDSGYVFRQFDNLKTLGMLAGISLPLQLATGMNAFTSHFSDGQFQTVYIYAIVELFKDRNCITLLDEPDSFLHPEWQYDFLKQVFDITDAASKNNHVLMSSHSAVTLIPHDRRKIKFFDIKNNYVNCYDLPKVIAIKKLSSDLIKYSEQEQLLSIINAIQIENKPVLFTEGSTDPIIIKEAWYKLNDDEMPFIPFYAFSCTYIKQLLTDNRIHREMGGLPVFALFDFDKAYDQWNGLNGTVTESDPFKGKIKKWQEGESYALMIPVPAHADIQKQVIRNSVTGETFGGDSCCEIEHLFYGHSATADFFQSEPCPGGNKITFKSDSCKTTFAREVVSTLPVECFNVFRPMFEFIKSKCQK